MLLIQLFSNLHSDLMYAPFFTLKCKAMNSPLHIPYSAVTVFIESFAKFIYFLLQIKTLNLYVRVVFRS